MERYYKFFGLPESLCRQGAPVTVETGALLRDDLSGAVYAQLQMKNTSQKTIDGMEVRLYPAAGEPVNYQYVNLNLTPGTSGCASEFISLPDTGAFQISVLSVQFMDGTQWTAPDDTAWQPEVKKPAPVVVSQPVPASQPASGGAPVSKVPVFLALAAVVLDVVSFIVNQRGIFSSSHGVPFFISYLGQSLLPFAVAFLFPVLTVLIGKYRAYGLAKPAAKAVQVVLVIQIAAAILTGIGWFVQSDFIGTLSAFLSHIPGSGILFNLFRFFRRIRFGSFLFVACNALYILKNVLCLMALKKQQSRE